MKILKTVSIITIFFVLIILVACDVLEVIEKETYVPPESSNQNIYVETHIPSNSSDDGTEAALPISPNIQHNKTEVKTPLTLKDLIGKHYQATVDVFINSGFTNIRTIPMENLITGWLRSDGEVDTISINGNVNFEPETIFPHDAEVVIIHHSFPISRSRLTLNEISLDIPSNWRSDAYSNIHFYYPTDSNDDGVIYFCFIKLDEKVSDNRTTQRTLVENFVNRNDGIIEYELEIAGRYAVRCLSFYDGYVSLYYYILTDYYIYLVGIDLFETSPLNMQHILESAVNSIKFNIWAPNPFTDAEVGDIVQFGGYDWRVLVVLSGQALVISENVIDMRYYHRGRTNVTWSTSSIRIHLNNTFLNSFNEAERALIREASVRPSDNPWYGTRGGSEARDRIFLLTIDEVLWHFGGSGGLGTSAHERTSLSDQFDSARVAYDIDGNARWWWLRSPGGAETMAAYVRANGAVDIFGRHVNETDMPGNHGGIRPAMWIRTQ